MTKMAPLVPAAAVFALVFALASVEVAAQGIPVTPADSTIAVGQTMQFRATGIDTARSIEAGSFHQCAVLEDTTLRCWGENDYGQLGNGVISSPPETPNPTPVAVVGVTGATAVSGGGFHTCAVLANGTVQCWGRDTGDPDGRGGGQLGNATVDGFASPTPVQVTGITTAIAVAAGGFHTCALLANGTVQCWGQNDQGQLGNGTLDAPTSVAPRNPTPVTVSGITDAIAVSAGGWHTCALLRNGTVRCWGDNERGAIGDGSPTPANPFVRRPTPTPVEVVGISTAVALEAGIFHTCVLLQDGRVECWGDNQFFQLGNDPPANNASSTPVTVNGVTSPAALAPGAEHSCVLLQDGRVECWGDNNFGQLGNGSERGIFNPPTAPVTGITGAVAATSGAEHTCALFRGGRVQCWGRGFFGRLGDGQDRNRPDGNAFTPVTVVGLGVTWTSSDPTVATIDDAGLATGRRAGSTTITATSGDRSGRTTLTVGQGTPGTRVTLGVIREGSGGGTVTSSDGSINCGGGGACSASYERGTVVSLRAMPASGSNFSGWRGCDTVSSTTCMVTMSEARSVVAAFDLQTFMLTVNKAGTGSGAVTSSAGGFDCPAASSTCSATYASGTLMTLRATPAAGSTFGGWSGCDSVSGTSCMVTMSAARSVTVTFTRQRFTLAVAREGTGGGIVTSDDGRINCGGGGACSASFDSGTQVTLRARPGLLSTFDGWSGGGCSGTGPCTVNLSADTRVTARFRLLGLF